MCSQKTLPPHHIESVSLRKKEDIMILTSTENIYGYTCQTLGLVQGSTIQSKNMFKDMGSGLKSMIGGELTAYTKMMEEAREKAIARMIDRANSLGADAIICVRFNSASVMQGAAEIMAYGTAVKLSKIEQ
jgi:uncharacterized protein YbjQ (UPF0145 family)